MKKGMLKLSQLKQRIPGERVDDLECGGSFSFLLLLLLKASTEERVPSKPVWDLPYRDLIHAIEIIHGLFDPLLRPSRGRPTKDIHQLLHCTPKFK